MKSFEYIPVYSYSDYRLWQGDWELINGYPHAMSPSPVRRHQLLVGKIVSGLSKELEKDAACKECEVYSDLDWIVNDKTVLRPDVMVVCGNFKEDFLTFPPVLVVEVLSPATSMKDRNLKYNIYQEQKVKYYIMVNPDNRACELYELVNGEYVPADNLTGFNLHGSCSLLFNIPQLVAQLPLD